MVTHVERCLESIPRIDAMGVSLAVDDFGTGFSSLAYLKRFHVDTLKVDQSSVRDVLRDSEGAWIVRAIVDLGRSLSLQTVAEGVERQEQADHLLAAAAVSRRVSSSPGLCRPTSLRAFLEGIARTPLRRPRARRAEPLNRLSQSNEGHVASGAHAKRVELAAGGAEEQTCRWGSRYPSNGPRRNRRPAVDGGSARERPEHRARRRVEGVHRALRVHRPAEDHAVRAERQPSTLTPSSGAVMDAFATCHFTTPVAGSSAAHEPTLVVVPACGPVPCSM